MFVFVCVCVLAAVWGEHVLRQLFSSRVLMAARAAQNSC